MRCPCILPGARVCGNASKVFWNEVLLDEAEILNPPSTQVLTDSNEDRLTVTEYNGPVCQREL